MEEQSNPYPLSRKTLQALDEIKHADSNDTAEIFRAISDPVRLKIVEALGQRELCVCVLVDLVDVQNSTLSYHLKQLKDAGLVTSDKDGNYLIYSLTPAGKTLYSFVRKLKAAKSDL